MSVEPRDITLAFLVVFLVSLLAFFGHALLFPKRWLDFLAEHVTEHLEIVSRGREPGGLLKIRLLGLASVLVVGRMLLAVTDFIVDRFR